MNIDQLIEDLLVRAHIPDAYRSGEFLSQMGFSIPNEQIDAIAEAYGVDLYDLIRIRLAQLVNVCTALDCTLDAVESLEAQIMENDEIDFLDEEYEESILN